MDTIMQSVKYMKLPLLQDFKDDLNKILKPSSDSTYIHTYHICYTNSYTICKYLVVCLYLYLYQKLAHIRVNAEGEETEE